jgi:hypothetical protein
MKISLHMELYRSALRRAIAEIASDSLPAIRLSESEDDHNHKIHRQERKYKLPKLSIKLF